MSKYYNFCDDRTLNNAAPMSPLSHGVFNRQGFLVAMCDCQQSLLQPSHSFTGIKVLMIVQPPHGNGQMLSCAVF
jgi:hypothetical protein